MKRHSLQLATVLLVSFLTSSGFSAGFYPINHESVPFAIKKAGASIFMLKVMALGEESSMQFLDVSTEAKVNELKAKFQKLSSDVFDQYSKRILLRQIELCVNLAEKEMKKSCPVTFDIRQGTGFLFGDGNTLWTNSHVVDDYLSVVEKFGGKPKAEQIMNPQKLRIFVFNQNGDIVLDPYKDEIKILKAPALTPIGQARNTFYAEDSDYIALSLSNNLGEPLKIAKQKPNVGEKHFIAGYAGCTGCTFQALEADVLDFVDRKPEMNSNGEGIQVNIGITMNAWATASFFQMPIALMNRWKLNQMIFSDSDSQHGQSGAPWLNENGEVFAVHSGGKSRMINGQFRRISRAVYLPDFF